MRPYNDSYEDFDDFNDFAFEKSQAMRKLLDEYRREDRDSRRDHRLSNLKYKRDRSDWDWEDFDDWD
jgi:arginine utilization protein RocB